MRHSSKHDEQEKLRKEWLFKGILQHGIDSNKLLTVYKQYANLGLVPTHYNYPILIEQSQKPQQLKYIEAKIFLWGYKEGDH